jgi:hypothetical protein
VPLLSEAINACKPFGEQPDEERSGKADDVQVVAFDALDKGGAESLNGVSAGPTLPFAGRDVESSRV